MLEVQGSGFKGSPFGFILIMAINLKTSSMSLRKAGVYFSIKLTTPAAGVSAETRNSHPATRNPQLYIRGQKTEVR